MDKVVFLFSKEVFTPEALYGLSREQCEAFAAAPNYGEDDSFVKVDATGCKTEREVMEKNGFSYDDYLTKSYGVDPCRVVSVVWDTDGVNPRDIKGLPLEVNVPYSIADEDIADYLSDTYGYCVESFSF